MGEIYAKVKGYKVEKFPADWEKHGKKAGFIRNRQMADYADMLICFWDFESKGSKNMIETARSLGLKTHIVDIRERNKSK
jgi:hypothetical protein